MDTEEPVDTRMYTADTLVDAAGDCVTNNVLTLYALWLKDEHGNGYPDALQVRVTFKAGANGKLTDPPNGAKPSSDGTLVLQDKNNVANGGHDENALLPGWSYYASKPCTTYWTKLEYGYIIVGAETYSASTSEEKSCLLSNA